MFNYQQPRQKPPADDDEDVEPSADERRLWQWRYQIAIEAGLADPDACLAADQGIDTHALADLTKAGCDPTTALRILLQ